MYFLPVLLCMLAAAAFAQDSSQFTRSEVMIPVRDGVKLQTAVFIPIAGSGPWPIIFLRTPYGIPFNENPIHFGWQNLADGGYIFVYQNIRGRFKSEGQFVMQRPVRDRKDIKSIDESTDAYDSIDWLTKHVQKNNGRVGMAGVSYDGWLVTMALLDPHPALRAASEQASPADMFLGDDFHHNGAFRLSYGFEYAALLETAKEENTNFAFDLNDTFQWYRRLGVLSNANEKYFHGNMPTWNDFTQHPNYDAFWQKQAFVSSIHQAPAVPNLNVGGWWDQEDAYGPAKIYDLYEKHDSRNLNYFVAGPWNHGGWRRFDGSKLGQIPFDSNTSKYYREEIEAPWFAYWLKDQGAGKFAEARVFQTGSNRWEHYDSWPPKSAKATPIYFQKNGLLDFAAPVDAEAFDSYLSDPAYPVPYRKRPISPTYPGGGWPAWLVEDQRFVEGRPDVAAWQTAPLDRDIKIAGDIVAQIYAATTGTDADWVVKLIDVYPETYLPNPELAGFQLMVASEILRGRFRESFEKPKPLKAGETLEYNIDLHTNDHAFLKGHRIMVQVQSTWFPLYDRNPQTYVANIFDAKAEDFRSATQKIFRSQRWPSHVSLPVVP